MNNCKYHRTRTKDYKQYRVCLLTKENDPLCRGCKKAEYKEYKLLVAKTEIKKVTSKQAKKERERYSIFTSDLKHCIECKEKGIERTSVNLHEICYGTGKRKLSIKYGTVIPLCNTLHHNQAESKGIHFDTTLCDKWHKIGQLKYMEYYNKTEEEFIETFGRNYIKE